MVHILGDIHGNFTKLNFKAMSLKDDTIIQVGDFGVGFRSRKHMDEMMEALNLSLSVGNNKLLVIRGNHDDPSYFVGNYNFSNIEFLPDYTVRRIENKNYLFVGGAISIDRISRKEGVSYWKDERFILDLDKINAIQENIDVVITHSSPTFCQPVGFNDLVWHYIHLDPPLYHELLQERDDLEKMYDTLRLKGHMLEYWLYGHFHFTKEEKINDTNFVVIGIDTFYTYY